MKEQRHRILCAVCALALVLTAVLAPAAWAADGAGEGKAEEWKNGFQCQSLGKLAGYLS